MKSKKPNPPPRMGINILMLYDIAGSASVLTRLWKKFKFGSCVLYSHVKGKDVVAEYYGERIGCPRFRDVVLSALKHDKKDVDIIWIHSAEIVIPIFKLLTRKKIVLHYHGSDLNSPGRSKNLFRVLCRSMADLIIYEQKAHLEKAVTVRKVRKEHIHNCIDTELFSKRKTGKGHVALISDNLDRVKTGKALEQFDDLATLDRSERIIPFAEMPEFLAKFDTLVDIKYINSGMLVKVYSGTALQSLSLGLKVHGWDGKVISGLPTEYEPRNILDKVQRIFLEIGVENRAIKKVALKNY